jgi:hypothetical protein
MLFGVLLIGMGRYWPNWRTRFTPTEVVLACLHRLPAGGIPECPYFSTSIWRSVISKSLAGDARLDIQRCGVTGMSMGAYASFLAFADISCLRAAVPMMGLPTFARRWQDLLAETAWSNPAWAAALEGLGVHTRQHSEFIQHIDPAKRLLQVAPRALLIMNGDFDNDQPKQYVLNWLSAAKAAYAACPEQLQWRVYPVGHTITSQMEQDAVKWLVHHLAGTEEEHAHPA